MRTHTAVMNMTDPAAACMIKRRSFDHSPIYIIGVNNSNSPKQIAGMIQELFDEGAFGVILTYVPYGMKQVQYKTYVLPPTEKQLDDFFEFVIY